MLFGNVTHRGIPPSDLVKLTSPRESLSHGLHHDISLFLVGFSDLGDVPFHVVVFEILIDNSLTQIIFSIWPVLAHEPQFAIGIVLYEDHAVVT